jgi:hypothetical protein
MSAPNSKSPAHVCLANGKHFMRWRGSHYRETADRRNRFIAPIRAGSSEWWTSPRLQRDRDEWTEVLQLPADTRARTKPTILGIAGGILEALIFILHRPTMDALSLGCSHEGSESGQGRYRHHKLPHCSLLLRFYDDNNYHRLH